jgi:hypothetical protein
LTWKEVKEFAHKHRTKILISTGVVVTVVAVVAGVLVWKHYYKGAPASGVSLQPMTAGERDHEHQRMLTIVETFERSAAVAAAKPPVVLKGPMPAKIVDLPAEAQKKFAEFMSVVADASNPDPAIAVQAGVRYQAAFFEWNNYLTNLNKQYSK